MNTLYKLSSLYNGMDGGLEEDIRYFKGETEIFFDFSEIGSSGYSIIKIVSDFGDKTPVYIRNYNYDDSNLIINEPIKHIYLPSPNQDNVFYYPTFSIFFSNFKKFIYQTPIRITKDSFYSKYKKLTVNSAQFIDDGNDTLFVTLQSLDGDILNVKIK